MIRYDSAAGIYTGDLMNCDLAEMTRVRCSLRDDAVWSDGTRVKIEDAIASVSAFAKHTPSAEMSSWISSLSLKKQGDILEISSKSKNPHMLELLTYPILRSDTIGLIESGTITPATYVTSGPYILMESVTDREYGYDRITFTRNEKSKRNVWLDKIHFKFFKDLSSLERSTETLTIVIPPAQNEKLDIGPRFREYLYTKYEYFGVFLNTKSMSRLLRNSLHWQIGTSFSGNIVDDHRRVDTLFLSGGKVLPTADLK
jgi:ABC-type oligopeptide transport system substrate-binding subunit